MMNIFKRFFGVKVTPEVVQQYINTGEVSESIIRLLAKKTIAFEKLNDSEMVIFCGKVSEINQMIIKLSKK